MKLTRIELHRLVWAQPVSTVARLLDLSSLQKVCKRYEIPTPGRGHWQRVRRGETVPAQPLRGDPNQELHFDFTPEVVSAARLAMGASSKVAVATIPPQAATRVDPPRQHRGVKGGSAGKRRALALATELPVKPTFDALAPAARLHQEINCARGLLAAIESASRSQDNVTQSAISQWLSSASMHLNALDPALRVIGHFRSDRQSHSRVVRSLGAPSADTTI